jgi:hypothetical protein
MALHFIWAAIDRGYDALRQFLTRLQNMACAPPSDPDTWAPEDMYYTDCALS